MDRYDYKKPMRVFSRKKTGLIYVSIADLCTYFEEMKIRSTNTTEKSMWEDQICKFRTMIFEGLDHDI